MCAGERADQGCVEAVVRVPGAGSDLCQGQGQHDRLPVCQVQGECYTDVLMPASVELFRDKEVFVILSRTIDKQTLDTTNPRQSNSRHLNPRYD